MASLIPAQQYPDLYLRFSTQMGMHIQCTVKKSKTLNQSEHALTVRHVNGGNVTMSYTTSLLSLVSKRILILRLCCMSRRCLV